ncbi:mechanosensitive ion channel family protein [Alteromonas sp. ASW11-130]|uniref:mechanosensitive ion channel family protein n=1 Tax=Alteromonas sp. ASW11-130 TaxID=3015775 RepID=UPI002242C376|nr:mechanosensitive ion channel family protein [Alteromonas sp. ASW11-130]MCW8092615.1 mechanosensitive ion channel family protein [Alteromonas sp. ASW11-130]
MVWINELSYWLSAYKMHFIWTVVMLVAYLAMTRFVLPRVESNIEKSRLKSNNAVNGLFVVRILTAVVTFSLILIAWGIDFSGLLVLSTSIITLTGVALFASWSLISNITAYFILLTNVAFRRGNYIRLLDGDNYIEGYIGDINLFNTRLVTPDRETVLYPNNLVLTRPVLINPKVKWQSMGKVAPLPAEEKEIKEIQKT